MTLLDGPRARHEHMKFDEAPPAGAARAQCMVLDAFDR